MGSNDEMVTSNVLPSVLFGMVNCPAMETAFVIFSIWDTCSNQAYVPFNVTGWYLAKAVSDSPLYEWFSWQCWMVGRL